MVIEESDFEKYFFPASENYKPEKGQVLVRWQAAGEFVDSDVKRSVIGLLCDNKFGAETGIRLVTKLVKTSDKEAVRVLREMAEDLQTMSQDEVAAKPYRVVLEHFYWAGREYVPDDPHWEVLDLIDLRKED